MSLGKLTTLCLLHTAAITALRFHPDGRALYSASADGTIKEWDSAERCLLNTLMTAGWTPTALEITPDGAYLVSPYSDGQIVLWDIATLRPVVQLTQHQKRVNAVTLSAQGKWLASASDDGTIKLWRWQRKKGPQLAKTIQLDRSGAAIKRDEKKSLSRRVLKAWAFSKGKFKEHAGELGAIALALYPLSKLSDQTQLIIATTTGLVQRYLLDAQMNPGEPIVFYQSPMPITAFVLSGDGILAIGSEDSVVTLWDIKTGECVAKLPHDWGVVAIAFSADSQTLITASADEVISIWQREAPSR